MAAPVRIYGKELLKVNVEGQPRNLVVLRGKDSVGFLDAHPLVEGFNAEHGTNLTVISHKAADVALTVGTTWLSLPPFPVDVAIAYEKSGVGLGKEIVFSADNEPRVILATGKYQGEKYAALVASGLSSKDFVRDGKDIILAIHEDRLTAVPGFPASNGWYMLHTKTWVPQGIKLEVESTQAALFAVDKTLCRLLWRLDSYAGLLARYLDPFFDLRHFIYADIGANYRPSNKLGVVAEVLETDVGKIVPLLHR